MVRWLTDIFKPKPCTACQALYHCIEEMKDEIQDLRRQRDIWIDRAMYPPLVKQGQVEQQGPRPHFDPIAAGGAPNWHKVRRKFEERYNAKPEDKTAEYWAKRNAEMEKQVPEVTERVAKGEDAEMILKELETLHD